MESSYQVSQILETKVHIKKETNCFPQLSLYIGSEFLWKFCTVIMKHLTCPWTGISKACSMIIRYHIELLWFLYKWSTLVSENSSHNPNLVWLLNLDFLLNLTQKINKWFHSFLCLWYEVILLDYFKLRKYFIKNFSADWST